MAKAQQSQHTGKTVLEKRERETVRAVAAPRRQRADAAPEATS